MATKPKNEPMCAVTIGYQTLLMPASLGMKVVQMLQSAFECDRDWGDDREYIVKEQITVEFRSVRASQIRFPEAVKRLLLEHQSAEGRD